MQPDVIIIGGGVIGAACAYFLAGRGAKVLVLERSHLGACKCISNKCRIRAWLELHARLSGD